MNQKPGKLMIPFEGGDLYVLPSFSLMAVLTHDARLHNGIHYAAPSMMALANLLAHRELGTHRRESTEQWPEQWLEALKRSFPDEWRDLAAHVGDGLRALLADSAALEDALFTVNVGLLEAMRLTLDELRLLGLQFVADVLEPLAVSTQHE